MAFSRSTGAARAACTTTALAGAMLVWLVGTAPEAGAEVPGPPGRGYYAEAEVLSVAPRYGWREVNEPVRRCVEPDPYRADHRHAHDHRRDPRHSRYHHDEGPGSSAAYRGGATFRRGAHQGGGAAAGLVGGLIGGLVGHQFGDGNGRKALTVLGALVGASVARDHVRRHREPDEVYHGSDRYGREPAMASAAGHCTVLDRTRRERGIQGYDVTYRYQGVTLHKWMHEHPGETVRVRVAVEPFGQ